jgi:hypothetical protein
MSCATHRLDGGIPMAMDIIDASGTVVDTIKN